MPYRKDLLPQVDSYLPLDTEGGAPYHMIIGDVQAMPLPDACCDSVGCSEVLEHLPRPEDAVAELARVLRPGGTLVLSVPFLSRLHEEPHDYFRYTSHGLRVLLTRHGFDVREIVATGSVFGFLGHQLSTLVVVPVYRIPVIGQIFFWVNALLVVLPAWLLDRLPGFRAKFPLGYVVVAERPTLAAPVAPRSAA